MFTPLQGLMEDPEHTNVPVRGEKTNSEKKKEERDRLMRAITIKDWDDPELIPLVEKWLADKKMELGDRPETMADQVRIQIDLAKLCKEAGKLDQAERILSSLYEALSSIHFPALNKEVEQASEAIRQKSALSPTS